MDKLIDAFQSKGLEIPEGLVRLIRSSSSRKAIYRTLWAAAKFGAGLGVDMKTYVFPKEVREAVREVFPEECPGAYDQQYEGRTDVYYVSIEEMVLLQYPKKHK